MIQRVLNSNEKYEWEGESENQFRLPFRYRYFISSSILLSKSMKWANLLNIEKKEEATEKKAKTSNKRDCCLRNASTRP